MNQRKAMGTLLLLSALLSGCGAHDAAQGSANAASANTGSDQTQQQNSDQQQKSGQQRPAMTQQERQMMFMFQSLISMDKSDGLSITKDEAQQMLPIVQDAISKGELTSDQQSKLKASLTADQKKFLDDAAARMQNRMNNRNNNGKGAANKNSNNSGNGNGSGNDGGNNASTPPSDQQNSEIQGQTSQSGQNGQGQNTQDNHQGQRRNGNGNGGFQNIGKQLVDLLQSKTK